MLEHPRVHSESGMMEAEEATLFLGADNGVQRLLATGNVNAETAGQDADRMRARADEAETLLTGKQNLLHRPRFRQRPRRAYRVSTDCRAMPGRAILDFLGQNQLQKVHAMDGVRLAQHDGSTSRPAADASGSPREVPRKFLRTPSAPQDFDLTAPVVDFFVAKESRLDHAETSGAAKITISLTSSEFASACREDLPASFYPSVPSSPAGRFDARFAATPDGSGRLSSIHGAPNAKIVNRLQGCRTASVRVRRWMPRFSPKEGLSQSSSREASPTTTARLPANGRKPGRTRRSTLLPTGFWCSRAVHASPEGACSQPLRQSASIAPPMKRSPTARQEHLQRTHRTTKRRAACVRFTDSRDVSYHDGAQLSCSRSVPGQRTSVAGREHRRGPFDPV